MKTKIIEHIEDNLSYTDNIHEAFYYINGKYVSGEFDCGSRGLDHNALIGSGYDFMDLLMNGVVIVPETNSYISDEIIKQLDQIGYDRLPLNNNHIVGYK